MRYGENFREVIRAKRVTWTTHTATAHEKKSAYLEVAPPVIADGVEIWPDGPRHADAPHRYRPEMEPSPSD